MASKSQRIQQGQILQEQAPILVEAGANPQVIAERFLESIGIDDVQDFFPPPSEEEQAMQQEAQARDVAAQDAQTKFMIAQAAALDANADNLRASAEVKRAKLPDEIEKLRAEMIKLLEQAESEQQKNNIDLYTSHIKKLDAIKSLTQTIGEINGNSGSPSGPSQQAAAQSPNASPQQFRVPPMGRPSGNAPV